MRAGQHRWGLLVLASMGAWLLARGGPAAAQPPVEVAPPEPAAEPADAASEAPDDQRVLVMVLPVDPANADAADALTELLIGAVASTDRATSIVGKEELQAQLDQSDEATLECIASSACLGRLGVQLGVAEILAATVARRDGRWVFDLHRLDPRSGQSVARAFREVDGELGELADAMLDALGALGELSGPTATLRIGVDVLGAEVSIDGEVLGTFTGAPLEVAELEPGEHEVRARAEGHLEWSRVVELEPGDVVRLEAALRPVAEPAIPPPPAIEPPQPSERALSPLLWVGMASAALGAGAALGFGISSQREPAAGVNRAEALAFVDDRRRDARIANAAMGIAVAGLGLIGAGLWLSDFGSSGQAQLRLGPRYGGAAVDWSTRW